MPAMLPASLRAAPPGMQGGFGCAVCWGHLPGTLCSRCSRWPCAPPGRSRMPPAGAASHNLPLQGLLLRPGMAPANTQVMVTSFGTKTLWVLQRKMHESHSQARLEIGAATSALSSVLGMQFGHVVFVDCRSRNSIKSFHVLSVSAPPSVCCNHIEREVAVVPGRLDRPQ